MRTVKIPPPPSSTTKVMKRKMKTRAITMSAPYILA